MAAIIRTIIQNYNYVVHDLADPRTKDWFAVSNPFVILSIVSAYLSFCKVIGPNLMDGRKPYELKRVIMLYNFLQVCFSIFLAYEGFVYIFHKDYNLACEPIDYSDNPRALRIAAGTWFYFFAKITELLDTVFFVLRKKYNQVTFLHMYHHTMMALSVWVGAKYFPGGHIVLMGFLNAIVHIVMYTYYLIAGLGPKYQKYIWWKKHVTLLQLAQFCVVFVHNFAVFFYTCDYPKALNLLSCLNAVAFIYMFGSFYLKSYTDDATSKKQNNGKPSLLSNNVDKYDNKQKFAEKSR